MTDIRVGFKRLTEDAIIPTKAHKSDSGFDLYATETMFIKPEQSVIIKTGIAIALPDGHEAQIRPRSGVTSRTKLRVNLGTIDEGYNGELGVMVDNITSQNPFKSIQVRTLDGGNEFIDEADMLGTIKVYAGDKVAQLVVQKLPEVSQFEIDGDMEQTERGSNGYGSTGV